MGPEEFKRKLALLLEHGSGDLWVGRGFSINLHRGKIRVLRESGLMAPEPDPECIAIVFINDESTVEAVFEDIKKIIIDEVNERGFPKLRDGHDWDVV